MKRKFTNRGLNLLALFAVAGTMVAVCDTFIDEVTDCAWDLATSALSPDGSMQAVVYSADCGATIELMTNVSIIRSSEPTPRNLGNVFAAPTFEYGSQVFEPGVFGVEVLWRGPFTLVIRYDERARYIRTKERRFKDVEVVLEPLPLHKLNISMRPRPSYKRDAAEEGSGSCWTLRGHGWENPCAQARPE